jgi:hypothetical protein
VGFVHSRDAEVRVRLAAVVIDSLEDFEGARVLNECVVEVTEMPVDICKYTVCFGLLLPKAETHRGRQRGVLDPEAVMPVSLSAEKGGEY